MNIIPYSDFDGNCEEALNRYKEIFNGEVVYLQRFKDGPGMEMSEMDLERTMHAQLKIGDMVLYLSDTFPGTPLAEKSRISLNLGFTDLDEQKRVYDALCQNGTITMPLEEQFWGDVFGAVTDEFGIPWSLAASKK